MEGNVRGNIWIIRKKRYLSSLKHSILWTVRFWPTLVCSNNCQPSRVIGQRNTGICTRGHSKQTASRILQVERSIRIHPKRSPQDYLYFWFASFEIINTIFRQPTDTFVSVFSRRETVPKRYLKYNDTRRTYKTITMPRRKSPSKAGRIVFRASGDHSFPTSLWL